MSISTQGYLSPEVSVYTSKLREIYSAEFALAQQINTLGQELLCSNPTIKSVLPASADTIHVMAMLFVRTMSNFQGALLLAERGMIVEARILTRSCFKSAVALCAAPN